MSTDSWTPPPPGSLAAIEIPATDLSRAKAFYNTVFGWNFEAPDAKHPADQIAKLESNATSLSGAIVKVEQIDRDPLKRSVLVHLWVKSVVEAADQIAKVGGGVLQEKEEQYPGFSARVIDSEGNVLGLFSLVD